jgi:geranylgeranyl pyrophosphate synthase
MQSNALHAAPLFGKGGKLDLETLKSHLASLPELSAWPELAALLRQAAGRDWALPLTACQAVCGRTAPAEPAAAAILMLQMAIIFVDDMLDHDPRGEHLRLGEGRTANLALALQSAAFLQVARSEAPAEQRAAALEALTWMALETARGQELDVQQPGDEGAYWQVVRAKSTPFYACALQVGGLLGGADRLLARSLHQLGAMVGEVVQLHDDMFDAFETPARPDWRRPGNNLLLLYAGGVEHPQREQFLAAARQPDDPVRLRQAQHILVQCGALSYCAYHLVERHRQAQALLKDMALHHSAPLEEFLAAQTEPINVLFQKVGVQGGLQDVLKP